MNTENSVDCNSSKTSDHTPRIINRRRFVGGLLGIAAASLPHIGSAYYPTEFNGVGIYITPASKDIHNKPKAADIVTPDKSVKAVLKKLPVKDVLVTNQNNEQSISAEDLEILRAITRIFRIGSVLPQIKILNNDQFGNVQGYGALMEHYDVAGYFQYDPRGSMAMLKADQGVRFFATSIHELLHGLDSTLNGILDRLDPYTAQSLKADRLQAKHAHRHYLSTHDGKGITQYGSDIMSSMFNDLGTAAWSCFCANIEISESTLTLPFNELSRLLNQPGVSSGVKQMIKYALDHHDKNDDEYFDNSDLGKILGLNYLTDPNYIKRSGFPPSLEQTLNNAFDFSEREDFAQGGKSLLFDPQFGHQHPDLLRSINSSLFVVTGLTVEQATPELQKLTKKYPNVGILN